MFELSIQVRRCKHVTGWLSLVAALGFGGWWLLRETRRQRATDERITTGLNNETKEILAVPNSAISDQMGLATRS